MTLKPEALKKMKEMKMNCTDDMMKKCFNDHDKDGNGYLNFSEFKQMCKDQCEKMKKECGDGLPMNEECIKKAFCMTDLCCNG